MWRIKYSASAGFVGGSPSNVQTPSATDEQILLSGGTDAAPTYTGLLGTDNTYRANHIVGDASVGYSFLFDTFPTT